MLNTFTAHGRPLNYEHIFKVVKINMSRLSPNMHTILKSDVIELLNSKQIYTVLDFIKADSRILEKISTLTFREILEIKKILLKRYSAKPRNALDYFKHTISNSAIIQTGIKNIDLLLEGGLFTANIYEICGLPAVGKTLFCLTLVKNVISNMKENIYYLDTKGDFCARKLKQMLFNIGKEDFVDAMNRTLVKRISTKYDLINSLHEIRKQLEEGLKLRVIIIDSLPALYLQSSNHTENNSFLNHTANILRYLAVEHHLVAVVSNLITLWNEGNFRQHGIFKERISCGNYWYNIPNVRLKFEKHLESKKCKVTLVKSTKIIPDISEYEVKITDIGLL